LGGGLALMLAHAHSYSQNLPELVGGSGVLGIQTVPTENMRILCELRNIPVAETA
jgi:hypothetical protein